MAVEVEDNGIIVVDDCIGADCTRFISNETPTLYKVAFQVVFENEEDSRRFYNALNASIQVKCIHIHFEGMEAHFDTPAELN